MNEAQIVSLVALTGWLLLMLGTYRAHRIDAKQTVKTALIWGSIFAGVVLFFSLVG